jgi:hypothetical protein
MSVVELRSLVVDQAAVLAPSPESRTSALSRRRSALPCPVAHYEEDHFGQPPADAGYGMPKVHLSLPRRLAERHENLLGGLPTKFPHCVLDGRVAPGEALHAQHLPHPLDRVTLLGWQLTVGTAPSFEGLLSIMNCLSAASGTC